MLRSLKDYRPAMGCTAAGILVCGLTLSLGGRFESAQAQTKEPPSAVKDKDSGKVEGKITVLAPPTDVNDLSMEVAALRTLYLLKAGPDQNEEYNSYDGIKNFLKDKEIPQPPRERTAKASKNYQKLLTDLREAFITNNEDQIGELSSQLDELTNDEQPDLDDAVEITAKSRGVAVGFLKGYMDARRIAGYIGAYGKDFPDPRGLMLKNTRDTHGKWPTKEVWKETRDFVVKEVGFAYAGLNDKAQNEIGKKTGELLDKAFGMSKEQMKKEFSTPASGLRKDLNELCNPFGPTDVIKHVLERDIAELFSNPRLGAAVKAREDYLKKKAAAPAAAAAANPK